MAKIQFENKVATKQSSKPRINCITNEDINEIKASVNSLYDNDPFNTTETETTYKYDNKNVYKITKIIDFSDLEFENNETDVDFESGEDYQVWIDFSHSFFEYYISSTNEYIKIPLNYIPFNSTDAFSSVRNKSISVLKVSQYGIKIFVGITMINTLRTYNTKLVLTVEYIKS